MKEFHGVLYTHETAMRLRDRLIAIRDVEMSKDHVDMALALSPVIALITAMINELFPEKAA